MTVRRIGTASLLRLLGSWQIDDGVPAYRRLAAALRLTILDGRLALDARLPGERDLAAALGLSRTTVAAAFAELRAEGYLASRQGAASTTTLPAVPATIPITDAAFAAETTGARFLFGDELPPPVDLSIAALPAGPEVHRAYTAALAALPAYLGTSGYDSRGLLEARMAVARRYTERGLPTQPDEVIIVCGALSAISLVLRLLTGPGDRVAVDHPTYPAALAAIQAVACRPVPVALPETGWDLDGLAASFAQTTPRLAYLVPDQHNPTGRCMDAETRRALTAIAARTRTTLVVDETMAELWYEEPPPPPLAAFDAGEQVITIGSPSKSIWGGLRLGWIRASARQIAALTRIRDTLDLGSPILEQLALARLLAASDDYLDARRAMLRERRDLAVATLGRLFPDWRVPVPAGGLCCWVELPRPAATRFAAAAQAIDIQLAPGPRFGVGGAFERYLRLPFTAEPELLAATLERLRPAWHRLAGAALSEMRDKVV